MILLGSVIGNRFFLHGMFVFVTGGKGGGGGWCEEKETKKDFSSFDFSLRSLKENACTQQKLFRFVPLLGLHANSSTLFALVGKSETGWEEVRSTLVADELERI